MATLIPLALAAAVLFAGAILVPLGPSTTASTTLSDDAGEPALAAEPAPAPRLGDGEPPRGSLPVYGMGLVAAAFLVAVALVTKGRFYP